MTLLEELDLANLLSAVLEIQAHPKAVLRCFHNGLFIRWRAKFQLDLPDFVRNCLEGVGQRPQRRAELVHVQVFLEHVDSPKASRKNQVLDKELSGVSWELTFAVWRTA